MTDFFNIDYLKSGTEKQKEAFETLNNHLIFQRLSPFTPVLVGTFPININVASSDLDIACHWQNKQEFIDLITNKFSVETNFQLIEKEISGYETVIANFYLNHFEIEIFEQNIPVHNQNGFLHMIIEDKILKEKGEDFRQQIIALKQNGLKTEPAFAQLLHLDGNPYEALLKYKV